MVKRAQTGGVSFSRDPLNLKNQYNRKVRTRSAFPLKQFANSRQYEGLVADKVRFPGRRRSHE